MTTNVSTFDVALLGEKSLTDLGRSAEAIGLFREQGASPAELGIALSRAGRASSKCSKPQSVKGSQTLKLRLAYAAALGAVGRHQRALSVLTQARKGGRAMGA